jgi:hypothetical protein
LRELEVAMELVAAFTRNHVEAHATRRGFGADRSALKAHFRVHRVVVVALHRAVGLQAVGLHAIDQHRRVRRAHAVRRHVGLLHRAGAPGVRQAEADADDELRQALDAAAGRNQVHRFAVEHRGLRRRGHVDDRRRAGDRDRFFEGADAELSVQRRGEFRRQHESVAPERLEAGERERHAVGAGSQVGDAIRTVAVRHC